MCWKVQWNSVCDLSCECRQKIFLSLFVILFHYRRQLTVHWMRDAIPLRIGSGKKRQPCHSMEPITDGLGQPHINDVLRQDCRKSALATSAEMKWNEKKKKKNVHKYFLSPGVYIILSNGAVAGISSAQPSIRVLQVLKIPIRISTLCADHLLSFSFSSNSLQFFFSSSRCLVCSVCWLFDVIINWKNAEARWCIRRVAFVLLFFLLLFMLMVSKMNVVALKLRRAMI